MDFQKLLDNITPDIYENLKRSVELGKWPDGNRLSAEQRQLCIQAVIAYEARHLQDEERSGYIPAKEGPSCGSKKEPESQPVKWQ